MGAGVRSQKDPLDLKALAYRPHVEPLETTNVAGARL
jgi:hypothetical protein